MDIRKLPTVIVANEYGGVVLCTEEDDVISGEVIVMQRSYRNTDNYLIEETRFAKLQDDICRMTVLAFEPGEMLPGNIIMKQRNSFAPGYVKMKGPNRRLLRDEEGLPVWGKTYYTEDYDDKDVLIESFKSL